MKVRPNIFLITIDSLRADHCQFLGYSKRTTPFLNSIVENSLVFLSFYANSIPTFFAFPVIMTGKKPFLLGETLGIPNGVETIAEILKREGYTTLAFVANNPALYEEFGYSRGFDVFDYFREYWAEPQKINAYLKFKSFIKKILPEGVKKVLKAFVPLRSFPPSAFELTDHVLRVLKSHKVDTPIFCWIHYMDTHYPYVNGWNSFSYVHARRKPTRFSLRLAVKDYIYHSTPGRGDVLPSSLIIVRDLYDAAISLVDSQIRKLVSEVNWLFKEHENFFIITSDHGEAFMEHGYGYHEPWGLHDELVKIPLLIFSSKGKIKGIVEHLSDHSKLMEIICSIAANSLVLKRCDHVVGEILYGCVAPHFKIRDNKTEINGYSKLAFVRMGDFKYIVNLQTGSEELYNVAVDPHERFNILENHRGLAREMMEIYEEWRKEREKEKIALRKTLLRNKTRRLKHKWNSQAISYKQRDKL